MQVLNLDEKNTERMDAINKFTLMDDTFMTQVFSSDLECTEELLKIIFHPFSVPLCNFPLHTFRMDSVTLK